MPTRRDIVTGSAALAATALLRPALAAAQLSTAPNTDMAAVIAEKTRGAAIQLGRVILGIPQIAESGLQVFTTISVDSPMTADDHVKAIHLFSEKNPIAHITSFHFGPRAGRAKVSTNVRLGASQRVIAIAEMSNGTFWSDEKSVVVTIAACVEGG